MSDYRLHGEWLLPEAFVVAYPWLANQIYQVSFLKNAVDSCVWTPSSDGILTTKAVYNVWRVKRPARPLYKHLFCSYIPPSRSIICWKALCNKLPTETDLAARGFLLPSMCRLCKGDLESSSLLFMHFRCAVTAWTAVGDLVGFHFSPHDSLESFFEAAM